MKILITGGTNGMGKGVAKILAGLDNQSHEIIILGRNKKLYEKVFEEIESATSNKKISFVLCDLAKLSDVKNAIQEIQNEHDFLDGIFINAGLGYASKRIETIDEMDAHFQVNYLSQFMLTLNLLNLLEKSKNGGRVVFNATKTKKDKIFWEDLQMKQNWQFEAGIHQAMVAKRMFIGKLNNLYRKHENPKVSFIGFQIHKPVWTNQLHIIPTYMRIMATIMKWFGTFISMNKCGEIMAVLFTESQEETLKRSGQLITWKENNFVNKVEDSSVKNQDLQDELWNISLKLCADEKTNQIAIDLQN